MAKVEAKQAVVNEIKEKLDRAVSIVLVDARGLTVAEDTDLRKQLREAGVDYKVYKNTMIKRAVKDTQFEGVDQFLEGPTAVVFSYDEATKGASIIKKVSETAKNLEFKAGIIEGIVYDATGMKAIADIPSREVLISKLLGSFKSPISTFARVINQIAEKKGEAAAE
ncbi:50S ribosomal protein L10 [Clostridiales bacterium]|nr:50S ribosomal protein L10 [Clostridiales bacterium]